MLSAAGSNRWLALHRSEAVDILPACTFGRRLAVLTHQSRLGEYFVFHATGRIDNQTSASFQTDLLAAVAGSESDLIIDFTSVEYISSAGLRALMMASRQMPKGRRIALTGLSDLVQEIFSISRFHRVIPVFSSTEAAIEVWQTPRQTDLPSNASILKSGPLVVRFWGTRGSLPAPVGHLAVRAKIRDALLAAQQRGLSSANDIDEFIDRELPFSTRGTYGGNTSCVEIVSGGDESILCDLGSGAREFGNSMLQRGLAQNHCYNVFLSHLHWDHIMGFPFFTPAYIAGNLIRIHGCHQTIREAMLRQQSDPCFPVAFETLGAKIEFVELQPGIEYQIAGLSVTAIEQFHSGHSYGYRFTANGKTIVYSTDCEHKTGAIDPSYPFVEFYRDADLLIFDAMYSLTDTISVKEDWGHSSNIVAVELAQMARVKRLVMFHHEPAFDDRVVEQVLTETIRFEEISRQGHKVEIMCAYDGLELAV